MEGDSALQTTNLCDDDRAELGVLFVHGIGEQAQGQTLAQCTEPLVEWLHEGAGLRDAGGVFAADTSAAALRPPLLADGVPAHAELLIQRREGGEARAQRWLCAEAWWGSQVLVPSIVDFTAWLVSRGTWLLLFHLDSWWLAPRGTAMRILLGLPTLLVWLLLSTAMNTLLLGAALLALVPLGAVRRVVLAVLRLLTGVLGDAYVLIRQPVQRAAFEETTVQALHWLQTRARRLVVVAHSQGAAVALETLRRPDAPPVTGFVSVGAGIAKLRALRWFEEQTPTDRAVSALAAPLLLAGAVVALRTRQLDLAGESVLWFGPGLLLMAGAMAVFGAWRLVDRGASALRASAHSMTVLAAAPGFVWHDVASTHDPVPLGTLGRHVQGLPAFEETRLAVLRSVAADHTHYWQAKASFVPLLVSLLARFAGASSEALQAMADRLTDARMSRDDDLIMLRWAGRLDLLAFVLPLLLGGRRLADHVASWREALRKPSGPADALADGAPLQAVDLTLGQAEGLLRWINVVVVGDSHAQQVSHAVNLVVAGLLMGLGLLLWRRISFALWERWADARTEKALRQRSSDGTDDNPALDKLLAAMPNAARRSLAGRLGVWMARQLLSTRKGTPSARVFAGALVSVFALAVILALAAPFAVAVLWTVGPAGWLGEAALYRVLGFSAIALLFGLWLLDWLGSYLDGTARVSKVLLRTLADHTGPVTPQLRLAIRVALVQEFLPRWMHRVVPSAAATEMPQRSGPHSPPPRSE